MRAPKSSQLNPLKPLYEFDVNRAFLEKKGSSRIINTTLIIPTV